MPRRASRNTWYSVAQVIRTADIVVAAVGRPGFVRGAWLKPGCAVIDVGINAVDDPAAKRGRRLVGDVAFDEAKRVASKITPAGGGAASSARAGGRPWEVDAAGGGLHTRPLRSPASSAAL